MQQAAQMQVVLVVLQTLASDQELRKFIKVQPDVFDSEKGAYVFVDAAQNGGSLTAGLVAAGVGGLKPPF